MSRKILLAAALALGAWLFNPYGSVGPAAAADTKLGPETQIEVKGVVTDAAGHPLLGAMVQASSGEKTVTRFTDKNGHYTMVADLPSDEYDLAATAFGFQTKIEKRADKQKSAVNFALATGWDPNEVSSAELMTFLPKNNDTRTIYGGCVSCHTLSQPLMRRGMVAPQWRSKILTMTNGIMFGASFSPAELKHISEVLQQYFGPGAAMPEGPNAVKHLAIDPAVTKATIDEYDTPTASFPHSVVVAPNGDVWTAEYDFRSNAMARFVPSTQTWSEFPVPIDEAAPHTPKVDKYGNVWTPGNNQDVLIETDGKTGKMSIYPYHVPGVKELLGVTIDADSKRFIASGHTVAFDKEGNLWFTLIRVNDILKFDPRRERFTVVPMPAIKTIPADSLVAWLRAPTDPVPKVIVGGSYDNAIDSKGVIWMSQLPLGSLRSYNPKTGVWHYYKFPDTPSIRGLAIDANDDIWFGNYHAHKLGMFDQKTGKVYEYQPPTEYATPYGLVFDQKGLLWYADFDGNHISSFNPKTKKFVEYPIPSSGACPRFISVAPDGRVWFTEFMQSKIGVLNPNGYNTPQQTASAH